MTVSWIFWVIPIFIFEVEKIWFCEKCAGKNFVFFIQINKISIEKNKLIKHELVHSEQFFRTLGLHAILYYTSLEYRLRAEVEAYRKDGRYTYNQVYSMLSTTMIKERKRITIKEIMDITLSEWTKDEYSML